MRTEILLQETQDTADLDLDLRISDVSEQDRQEFGRGTYTSPSSFAIGTRCPVCC
ncbi:SCO0268 family class II lanthipeptide [Streptomyces macrosporus]|uniref:SCO0268 family class II lanthipeptide n=1 Tax=Streptomyces macrosporus TaxID=44032 RepID=A0ABP5W9Y8_9ACTN